MPIYKKLPRSKPRKPDEFVSFFDRLYHKAYARGPAVLTTLGVFLFVILGVLFWKNFHEKRSNHLAENILAASKKGPEQEMSFLREIKKTNLYAPLGLWSSLEIANLAMQKNDCDTVLKELDPYVGKGEDKVLRSLIYLRVGACLQDKKDFKRAEEVYVEGASDSRNFLRDWSLFYLATVKKNLGDTAGAQKILGEILEKDSTASPAVKEEARGAIW